MSNPPAHKRRRGSKMLPNGRSNGDGKHIRIYRYLSDSPAYRDMTALGRCALQELMFRFNGQNNGHIPFSVREMADRLNVTPRTANKALWSVIEHGFAKEQVKGSFTLKARHSTEWLLTMEGYPTANDTPTKDFMRWKSAAGNKPWPKKQNTVSKFTIVSGKNCYREKHAPMK
jgi:hypothetical protein